MSSATLKFLADLKKVRSSDLSSYVLSGGCRFFKERALKEIILKHDIPLRSVFRLEDMPRKAALDRIQERSFMEKRKLFVWFGFEKVEGVSLEEVLPTLPSGHFLVWETLDTRNPLRDKEEGFQDKAVLVCCETPWESKGEVSQWIQHRLQSKNVSPEVAQEMASIYGSDLHLLDAELEKIQRYPGALTMEVMRSLVTKTERSGVQDLLDMVALRNTEKSLHILSLLLGSTPISDLLGPLSKFLSQVLSVASMAQGGKDGAEISDVLNMSPPQVQRLRTVASRFSMPSLVHALNQLAQIDFESHRGGDKEALLQRMVYLLCSNPEGLTVKYKRGLR